MKVNLCILADLFVLACMEAAKWDDCVFPHQIMALILGPIKSTVAIHMLQCIWRNLSLSKLPLSVRVRSVYSGISYHHQLGSR